MMENIEKLLEAEILKEKDQYLDPVYRDHWRTSNLGRCFRMQWWYRKGEEMTNPIELKTLKVFRVGDLFHRDLQALLDPDKVEVDFTVDDVHGHADRVEDDFVEDFKTVGNFQWRLLTKNGHNVEKDKETYLYQLMTYCYFLNKPVGKLTFICKDTYEMRTYTFELEQWRDRVIEELEKLRAYWKTDIRPPAAPRAYNLKDCFYCPFRDKCDQVEGNTAKDRELSTKPERQKVF